MQFKTYEAVLMPTEDNKGKRWLKNCVWVIIGIIFIGSVVLDTNVFEELFWPVRIFFIILAIKFEFYGGREEYMPSPMELHFYND